MLRGRPATFTRPPPPAVQPTVDTTPTATATSAAPPAPVPALPSSASKPFVPTAPPDASLGGDSSSLTESPRPSEGGPDKQFVGGASSGTNIEEGLGDGDLHDDGDDGGGGGAVLVDGSSVETLEGERGQQEVEDDGSLDGGGVDGDKGEDIGCGEGGGRCVDDDNASVWSITPQEVEATKEEEEEEVVGGEEVEVGEAAGGESSVACGSVEGEERRGGSDAGSASSGSVVRSGGDGERGGLGGEERVEEGAVDGPAADEGKRVRNSRVMTRSWNVVGGVRCRGLAWGIACVLGCAFLLLFQSGNVSGNRGNMHGC